MSDLTDITGKKSITQTNIPASAGRKENKMYCKIISKLSQAEWLAIHQDATWLDFFARFFGWRRARTAEHRIVPELIYRQNGKEIAVILLVIRNANRLVNYGEYFKFDHRDNSLVKLDYNCAQRYCRAQSEKIRLERIVSETHKHKGA